MILGKLMKKEMKKEIKNKKKISTVDVCISISNYRYIVQKILIVNIDISKKYLILKNTISRGIKYW